MCQGTACTARQLPLSEGNVVSPQPTATHQPQHLCEGLS